MSAQIEIRKYLAYMRNGTPIVNKNDNLVEEKKKTSMRDMLGKMRSLKDRPLLTLNEDSSSNLGTDMDKKNEENKMSGYFEENNVTIEFELFVVKGNGIILGGTIDGQIQFVYKVTPDENTSGIELNYLDDFNSKDPENEVVVKKIEDYYNIFYKYWRDQIFN